VRSSAPGAGPTFDWPERIAVACAVVVLAGHLAALPSLGRTAEDHHWEGVFTDRSVPEIFCQAEGSYRPLCGLILRVEAPLPAGAALLISLALHLMVALLAGALAWRLAGRRAALWATLVPLVWSTQAEVVAWLGGRCELAWTLPGLLGAHAMTTGLATGKARWSLATAACCAVAALGKEPGFLLLLAYAPLLVGRTRREIARQLTAPALASIAALILRTVAAQGAGRYAARLIAKGPIDWAGNLAYGVTKLALGAVVHWPNAVAVVVPLIMLGGLAWIAARRRTPRALVAIAGLCALLAPTALVHAPRTLYGVVAYLAVALGALVADRPRARVALAAALILHAGAALVTQRLWVHVTAERREVIAQVHRSARESGIDRVRVVGIRWRAFGIPASPVADVDFAPPLDVAPLLMARYAQNELPLLRPARVIDVGRCEVQLEYEMPPGAPSVPADARLARGEPGTVRVQFDEAVVLVHADRTGHVDWTAVPCAR